MSVPRKTASSDCDPPLCSGSYVSLRLVRTWPARADRCTAEIATEGAMRAAIGPGGGDSRDFGMSVGYFAGCRPSVKSGLGSS